MARFYRMAIAFSCVAFLGAGAASAGMIQDSLAQLGVSSGGGGSQAAIAQPAVASAPVTTFTARGSETLPTSGNTIVVTPGACTDDLEGCQASKGDCSCITYTGSVTGTKVGKGTMTLNLTLNDDDVFGSGDGSCQPSGGHGKICDGNNASCLAFYVQGPTCVGASRLDSPNTGNVVVNFNGVFEFVPQASTGSAKGALGEGNFTLANDVEVVNKVITSSAGHVFMDGAFQAH